MGDFMNIVYLSLLVFFSGVLMASENSELLNKKTSSVATQNLITQEKFDEKVIVLDLNYQNVSLNNFKDAFAELLAKASALCNQPQEAIVVCAGAYLHSQSQTIFEKMQKAELKGIREISFFDSDLSAENLDNLFTVYQKVGKDCPTFNIMRTPAASLILKNENFEKNFVGSNPEKQDFFNKLITKENEEDFKCFDCEKEPELLEQSNEKEEQKNKILLGSNTKTQPSANKGESSSSSEEEKPEIK
jgi:hypothetical protein